MMGFISEFVLHARSADNGDWHEIITGFHVANQNIASRKNIKKGYREIHDILLSLSLALLRENCVVPILQ